jgi:DNA-binding CsgD family transcriptional regulator
MTTTSLPRPSTRPLALAVLTDWRRISQRPGFVERVRAWRLPIDDASVEDPDLLLAAVGMNGSATDSVADAALLALVRIAADDALAARVVLQRVLPGLVAIARRRGGAFSSDQRRAFDEVLAAAWEVIRTYPCERRPAKIASNIVRDSEYHAFVRTRRLLSATEQPTSHLVLESDASTAANDEGVAAIERRDEVATLLERARAAGMDPRHLAVVRGFAEGRSTDELAERYDVSSRTIRYWRTAAMARLRDLAAA